MSIGSPEILFQSADKIKTCRSESSRNFWPTPRGNHRFYRDLFDRHCIDISAIRDLDDLETLPTTAKEDLQRRNDDFLCVSRDRIAEYTTTSGTLGSPVTIALTAADLDRLAYNEYLSFRCADGTAADTYQLMLDTRPPVHGGDRLLFGHPAAWGRCHPRRPGCSGAPMGDHPAA